MDLESQHPKYEDYKKALSHAQKSYDFNKSEIGKINLGLAHYFNGNYDTTINLMNSVNLDNHPVAAYWIGLSYIKKNDLANAKYYLQKAVDKGVEVPTEVIKFLNSN